MNDRLTDAERLLGERDKELAALRRELAAAQDRYDAHCNVDQLTGLTNSRHFAARLADEVERSRRFKSPFGLVVATLTDFDPSLLLTPAGEERLVKAATVIEKLCRRTDQPARLEGATFGMILPGADMAGASIFADRLRRAVEKEALEGSVAGTVVRAAIGVAGVDEGESVSPPAQMLHFAKLASDYAASNDGQSIYLSSRQGLIRYASGEEKDALSGKLSKVWVEGFGHFLKEVATYVAVAAIKADPAGNRAAEFRSIMGRLKQRLAQLEPVTAVVTFSYDAGGRLTVEGDPRMTGVALAAMFPFVPASEQGDPHNPRVFSVINANSLPRESAAFLDAAGLRAPMVMATYHVGEEFHYLGIGLTGWDQGVVEPIRQLMREVTLTAEQMFSANR
ncbi:MAG: GGDEF domain-containing protein [Nitrospinae bacterium]|nr:GGDEF domain-containing protein [Nitrospinota bacterium]